MDREQKAAAVAELTENLKGAETIFAVDYRGISVTQAAELRTKLAEADAVFKVVKNRLAKRAVADAGTEGVDELLVGPTALTLISGDAVVAAKAIATFTREHGVLEYKGGFMDGEALDADGFNAIARLPGLDVLHGQLVGLAASPLTGLVAGLSNMISGLGRQLAQIAEQGLVSGEPPAAEEEPPAEQVEQGDDAEQAEEADRADEEPAEDDAADAPAAEEAPEETDAPDPDAPGREPDEAAGSDSDEQEQEEPSGDEGDN
jgi:large subunit ribosomal protein L10